jgi:hypothetical protein
MKFPWFQKLPPSASTGKATPLPPPPPPAEQLDLARGKLAAAEADHAAALERVETAHAALSAGERSEATLKTFRDAESEAESIATLLPFLRGDIEQAEAAVAAEKRANLEAAREELRQQQRAVGIGKLYEAEVAAWRAAGAARAAYNEGKAKTAVLQSQINAISVQLGETLPVRSIHDFSDAKQHDVNIAEELYGRNDQLDRVARMLYPPIDRVMAAREGRLVNL